MFCEVSRGCRNFTPAGVHESRVDKLVATTTTMTMMMMIPTLDRVAGDVIDEADKRGVMVLITERMSESLAILVRSITLFPIYI